MDHEILLPIADLLVNPYLVILIGFVGGIFTGMLGVGGGLFITPTLMLIGIPPLMAVACQVNSMIGVSLIGYLSYKRNQDVDVSLGRLIILGGVIGSYLGVILLDFLGVHGIASRFINVGYIAVLVVMTIVLTIQSLKNLRRIKSPNPPKTPKPPYWVSHGLWVKHFKRTRIDMGLAVPVLTGVINGIFISVLGMGNGVFLMPALAYLVGRTSPVVYGTALMSTVVVTIVSTLGHSLQSGSVDLLLVGLLLVGGLAGSQFGVHMSYLIHRPYLGLAGAGVMFLMLMQFAVKYTWPDLFAQVTAQPHHEMGTYFLRIIADFMENHPYLYALAGIFLSLGFAFLVEIIVRLSEKLMKNGQISEER